MSDSASAVIIRCSTDNIIGHIPDASEFTRIGVWEICIKSVSLFHPEISGGLYSLETDLVRHPQVHENGQTCLKSCVMEIFEATWPVTVHQGSCNVWHKITNPSTTVRFKIRNILNGAEVITKDIVVIQMLYRRKR